jgi:Eukaryotic aspartyl protease
MNVLLDTGSSALALDGHKYKPDTKGGDEVTALAQYDAYGDKSSWTGAVIKTTVGAGSGTTAISATEVSLAVAYDRTANMFRGADGILGLAYQPLDDAFQMPESTWPKRYTQVQVRGGTPTTVVPFLTQLADEDIAFDRVSFLTRRSFTHQGGGGENDVLNQGVLVVGGGEESTDLYKGNFQVAKVVADEWYNTNLKAIKVGGSLLHLHKLGPRGMPSNSIVDSGTNSLNFGPSLLNAIVDKFSPEQRTLLATSIGGNLVAAADLDLANWPTLTFVLEGLAGDVTLEVKPSDYWQVNTEQVGAAAVAITSGQERLSILGLPLMNGYFTIFDGEGGGGKGAIKFATAVR